MYVWTVHLFCPFPSLVGKFSSFTHGQSARWEVGVRSSRLTVSVVVVASSSSSFCLVVVGVVLVQLCTGYDVIRALCGSSTIVTSKLTAVKHMYHRIMGALLDVFRSCGNQFFFFFFFFS